MGHQSRTRIKLEKFLNARGITVEVGLRAVKPSWPRVNVPATTPLKSRLHYVFAISPLGVWYECGWFVKSTSA